MKKRRKWELLAARKKRYGLPFPLNIGNCVRWWDAPTMGLANGDTVSSWVDRIAGDAAICTPNATPIITYATNAQNGLGAVAFAGTAAAGSRLIAGFGNVHSNTDGLMVFVVAKWNTSTRCVISKHNNASGARFWDLDANTAQIWAAPTDADALDALTWNAADLPGRHWAAGAWGVVCLTWTPGATFDVYLNNIIVPHAGAIKATIGNDDGNDMQIQIGDRGTGDYSSPLNGSIGEIVIISAHTAALRAQGFKSLGAKWAITQAA